MVRISTALALGLAGSAAGASAQNKRVPPPEILEQLDDSVLGSINKGNAKRVPPPKILEQLDDGVLGSIDKDNAKRVPPPEILDQLDDDVLGSITKGNAKRVPPPEILAQLDDDVLGSIDRENLNEEKRTVADDEIADIIWASREDAEEKRAVSDEDIANIIWANEEKRSTPPAEPENVEVPSEGEIFAAWAAGKKRAVRFNA